MIAITPAMIGPGIEEEYGDARAAIDDMRVALGPQRLTNNTPEGRVLLNSAWVEQEIIARRLPIPVDPSFVSTIFYLVGSNELAGYAGFQEAIERLWLVLKGYGLIKPRHLPVLVAMIDDFLADAQSLHGELSDDDRALLADLGSHAEALRAGHVLDSPSTTNSFSARSSETLDRRIPQGYGRLRSISAALLRGWRPPPARKPPLAAPVPGLPATAPPLPSDMDDRIN